MYTINKETIVGTVIWANKNIYYDKPNMPIKNQKNMFLITYVNDDYFLGCPLAIDDAKHNKTVLRKMYYPIKHDSKIIETLYKLTCEDIVSDKYFEITAGTFEYFTRMLYQRIAIRQMENPDEYSEAFAKEYLKTHKPEIGNIIAYPTEDKVFKYYYMCGEDEENYLLLKLNKVETKKFEFADNELILISKDVRFYDYFSNSTINNFESNDKLRILEQTKKRILVKK